MTRRLSTHSIAVLEPLAASDGVVKDATGIPTAFRIWRAGVNVVDDGQVLFTPRSGALLMSEQASRGRPYSIDFDHLSLVNDRPAEAGRASGYHRIEVRDGELWAVDVEWSPDVREGLAENPPRWRYFSPAFFRDSEGSEYEKDEVYSYINLALCINPMTHGIPLLASHKAETKASRNERETPMTAEEQLAALDAMIEAEGDADKKAALTAAREALAAKGSDDVDANADKDADADAEGEDKKDPPPSDDDEDKKKTAAAAATTHAASGNDAVTNLAKRVFELEREREVSNIDAMLSKHPTLPADFAKHCRGKSYADAKASIEAVVGAKTHATRRTTASQGAGNASSGLDPRDEDYLDRAMGVKSPTAVLPTKRADGTFVMHNIRPSDLLRLKAQKGAA